MKQETNQVSGNKTVERFVQEDSIRETGEGTGVQDRLGDGAIKGHTKWSVDVVLVGLDGSTL